MRFSVVALGLAALSISSCKKDDNKSSQSVTNQQVVTQYADVVLATYTDVLAEATKLQTAINAFVANPGESTLAAAKAAWIEARMPYGRSEAFRFYGGPIDAEPNGPEGLINSWPMDEAFVDYTVDDPNSGIINDPDNFPSINESVLEASNQSAAEEDVSTGWHAIEFLLWGQDLSASGPGNRPYTDFVDGGTASHQDRRREYLTAVTNLLVENIQSVLDQWKAGGTYRVSFTAAANADQSLQALLTGIGKFAKGELGGERMKAYITHEQEDEQSCFSDNTTNDHIAGQEGIMNVYYGKYTKLDGTVIDGPGVNDLVNAKDPSANEAMISALDAAYAAVKAIPAPFDQAILVTTNNKVEDASKKVQAEGDKIVVAAKAIGISVTL